MTLDSWAASQSGRCPDCGFDIKHQGCACAGLAARNEVLPAVTEAHPDEARRLEVAIRRLAATGRVFSANAPELRFIVAKMHGPVVGSTFGHLSRAGVIRKVGTEPSTLTSTKGHDIKTWVGASA